MTSLVESLSARSSEKMVAQIFRLVLACLAAAAVMLYIYRSTISQLLGRQTAEVANITLQDETVQIQVGAFAKELLNQLIGHYSNDPGMRIFLFRLLIHQRLGSSLFHLSRRWQPIPGLW